MLLNNKIKLVDLGILVEDTLIFGDVHVGYEEALNKRGILVPRFQSKEIMKQLETLLEKTKPKVVVINGDLKHEFGVISDQEWRDALKVIDLCAKYADKLYFVKGNHDKSLDPIARKRDIKIVDQYRIGDVLVLHGDVEKELDKKIKTVIIGHEHPAIKLKTKLRSETYKCYLYGKYKKLDLIVMPSFNPLTQGTDVLSGNFLSPFLKKGISKFTALIIGKDGEVLDFGKIKDIE